MFNRPAKSTPNPIDGLAPDADQKSRAPISLPSENAHPRKRILIIDDDPDFLVALRIWFSKDDFEVLLASNGDRGYTVLRESGPVDLVLTDFMMPELNGIDLIRLITSDITTLRTPIVIMSNNSGPEHQLRAHRLGAIDYLLKGLGARAIAENVVSLLASPSPKRLAARPTASSTPVQAMRSGLISLIQLTAQWNALPIRAKNVLYSAERFVKKLLIAVPEDGMASR
jgi:DNA-binding response OmpR family regulator